MQPNATIDDLQATFIEYIRNGGIIDVRYEPFVENPKIQELAITFLDNEFGMTRIQTLSTDLANKLNSVNPKLGSSINNIYIPDGAGHTVSRSWPRHAVTDKFVDRLREELTAKIKVDPFIGALRFQARLTNSRLSELPQILPEPHDVAALREALEGINTYLLRSKPPRSIPIMKKHCDTINKLSGKLVSYKPVATPERAALIDDILDLCVSIGRHYKFGIQQDGVPGEAKPAITM